MKHGKGHHLLSKTPDKNKHHLQQPKEATIKITPDKIEQWLKT